MAYRMGNYLSRYQNKVEAKSKKLLILFTSTTVVVDVFSEHVDDVLETPRKDYIRHRLAQCERKYLKSKYE